MSICDIPSTEETTPSVSQHAAIVALEVLAKVQEIRNMVTAPGVSVAMVRGDMNKRYNAITQADDEEISQEQSEEARHLMEASSMLHMMFPRG